MALYKFYIDVTDAVNEFHKNILSVNSHNYRIEEIFRMVVGSYRKDHVTQMQYIGRFCMYYAEDGNQPAIDSQIMLNGILGLRITLFNLLDKYMLVNIKNEENQYPVELRFIQFKNNHLLLEYEYTDHGSTTI